MAPAKLLRRASTGLPPPLLSPHTDSEEEVSIDDLDLVKLLQYGSVFYTALNCFTYPLAVIKTRMQALSQPGAQLSNSTFLALRTVVRREGMLGLYKGFNAMAWGVGPAHAVYFATYEGAKEALGGNRPGHQVLATGAAGALATVAADAVMTPLDVVKQRLQLANTPYKGMLDCFVKMLKHEGPGAFYRSYQTTLVMNIPFTAVHFATYESSMSPRCARRIGARTCAR